MEERIKNIVFSFAICTCVVLFFKTVLLAGYISNQTNKVLDRIEQLEAQIDKLERTNKQ